MKTSTQGYKSFKGMFEEFMSFHGIGCVSVQFLGAHYSIDYFNLLKQLWRINQLKYLIMEKREEISHDIFE